MLTFLNAEKKKKKKSSCDEGDKKGIVNSPEEGIGEGPSIKALDLGTKNASAPAIFPLC